MDRCIWNSELTDFAQAVKKILHFFITIMVFACSSRGSTRFIIVNVILVSFRLHALCQAHVCDDCSHYTSSVIITWCTKLLLQIGINHTTTIYASILFHKIEQVKFVPYIQNYNPGLFLLKFFLNRDVLQWRWMKCQQSFTFSCVHSLSQ